MVTISGWIKLHRSILDHWVFEDPEKFKLWTYILTKASYKDCKISVRGSLVSLEPGEVVFGRKKWSEELKIAESKLYRSIKLFEAEGMVITKKTNRYSVIKIVNWSKYQADISEQQSDYKGEHQSERSNERLNEQQETASQSQSLGLSDRPNELSSERLIDRSSDRSSEHNTRSKERKNIPYSQIRDKFNEICVSLPNVSKITVKRKKLIEKLWESIVIEEDMDEILKLFNMTAESDFLCGRLPDPKWKACFDWIINTDHAIKILEGNYNNKETELRSRDVLI